MCAPISGVGVSAGCKSLQPMARRTMAGKNAGSTVRLRGTWGIIADATIAELQWQHIGGDEHSVYDSLSLVGGFACFPQSARRTPLLYFSRNLAGRSHPVVSHITVSALSGTIRISTSFRPSIEIGG